MAYFNCRYRENDEVDLEDGEIASDEEGDKQPEVKQQQQQSPSKKPQVPAQSSPQGQQTSPQRQQSHNRRGSDGRRGRDNREERSNRRPHHSEPERKKKREDVKDKDNEKAVKKEGDTPENEDELLGLCVRGASPEIDMATPIWNRPKDLSDVSWQEAAEEGEDDDDEDERKRHRSPPAGSKKGGFRRNREDMELRTRVQAKRKMKRKTAEKEICVAYLKGSCNKGPDCPYSHLADLPRKMELCKFYLKDRCMKRDMCLYLHEEFPCKFFHTGMKCYSGKKCKFSHEPLNSLTKEILIKHMETAPKEILGDFPRLSRENLEAAVGGGEEERPGGGSRKEDDGEIGEIKPPRQKEEGKRSEEDSPRQRRSADRGRDHRGRNDFRHGRGGRHFGNEGGRRDGGEDSDDRRHGPREDGPDDRRFGPNNDQRQRGPNFDDRNSESEGPNERRFNQRGPNDGNFGFDGPNDRRRGNDQGFNSRFDGPNDRGMREDKWNDGPNDRRFGNRGRSFGNDRRNDGRGRNFGSDDRFNAGNRNFQVGDGPSNRNFQGGDVPGNRNFQGSDGPGNRNFHGDGPGNPNFQGDGPGNRNFQGEGPWSNNRNGPEGEFPGPGAPRGPENDGDFASNADKFESHSFPEGNRNFGPMDPNGFSPGGGRRFGNDGPDNRIWNFDGDGGGKQKGGNYDGKRHGSQERRDGRENFQNRGPGDKKPSTNKKKKKPFLQAPATEDTGSGTSSPFDFAKELEEYKNKKIELQKQQHQSPPERPSLQQQMAMLQQQMQMQQQQGPMMQQGFPPFPPNQGFPPFLQQDQGRCFPNDDRPFFNDDRGRQNFPNNNQGRQHFLRDDDGRPNFPQDDQGRHGFQRDHPGRQNYQHDNQGRQHFQNDGEGRPNFHNDDRGRPNYQRDDQGRHDFPDDESRQSCEREEKEEEVRQNHQGDDQRRHSRHGQGEERSSRHHRHHKEEKKPGDKEQGNESDPNDVFPPPFTQVYPPFPTDEEKPKSSKEKSSESSRKHRKKSKRRLEIVDEEEEHHKRSKKEKRHKEKRQPVIVSEDGSFGGIKFKIKLNRDKAPEVQPVLPASEFLSSDDERPLSNLVKTAKKDDENKDGDETDTESRLVIETHDEPETPSKTSAAVADEPQIPVHLPQRQKELFLRIQSQVSRSPPLEERSRRSGSPNDRTRTPTPEPLEENWYSSDDEPAPVAPAPAVPVPAYVPASDIIPSMSTIPMPAMLPKPVITPEEEPFRSTTPPGPPPQPEPPKFELAALKDLSKINITELLSSIRQVTGSRPQAGSITTASSVSSSLAPEVKDPRTKVFDDVRNSPGQAASDKPRRPSEENKPSYAKSIYDMPAAGTVPPKMDSDLRFSEDLDERSNPFGDVDLRTLTDPLALPPLVLGLPFKPAPIHMAATEIEAGLASHPPIDYKVSPIYVPPVDFTSIKIAPTDPQVKKDPRLRRLYRISSVEEQKAEETKKPSDPRRKAAQETPKSPQQDTPFSPPHEPPKISKELLASLFQLGLSAAAGGADPRLRGLGPQEVEALRTAVASLRPEDIETLTSAREHPLPMPVSEPPRMPGQGLLPTPVMGLLPTPPNFMMNPMGLPMDPMMVGPMVNQMGPGPMGSGPMGMGPFGFGGEGMMGDIDSRGFRGYKGDRRGNRGSWRGGGRDRNWDNRRPRDKRDDRGSRHRDKDDRKLDRNRSQSPTE